MIKLYKICFFPSCLCILKLALNTVTKNPYSELAAEIVHSQGESLAHEKSTSLTPSPLPAMSNWLPTPVTFTLKLILAFALSALTFTILGSCKCFLKLLPPKASLHLLLSCFSFHSDCAFQFSFAKAELRWCQFVLSCSVMCLTLCDPVDCSLPGFSVHGDSPGKNTGVGCYAFLQGIFPTMRSSPGLPHCRRILDCLSHQESPRILEWVACPFSRGSSRPRNRTVVTCIAGGFFTSWATDDVRPVLKKLPTGEDSVSALHNLVTCFHFYFSLPSLPSYKWL